MNVSRFLWRSVVIAAGLAATSTAAAWALLGGEFALGIALGTSVAHASFVGLARDLSAALGVAAAQGHSLAAATPSGQPSGENQTTPSGPAPPSENGEIPAPTSDPAQIVGLDGARQIRARSLLKWPLVGLALAGILWYMPARPEGVALGVVLSLAAAVLAALFEPRGATSPEGSPEGPTAPPPGE